MRATKVSNELRVESEKLRVKSCNLSDSSSPRPASPASGRGAGGEGLLQINIKLLAMLDTAIHGEMDRISQQLTSRVKELADRYDEPMPAMVARVSELESKVASHLERMGFAWKIGRASCRERV